MKAVMVGRASLGESPAGIFKPARADSKRVPGRDKECRAVQGFKGCVTAGTADSRPLELYTKFDLILFVCVAPKISLTCF